MKNNNNPSSYLFSFPEGNTPEIFTNPDIPAEMFKSPKEWSDEEKEYWIRHNQVTIYSAIDPFRGCQKLLGIDQDDMFQTAIEVALRCFDAYEPKKPYKLATYIFRAISNYFKSAYRSAKSTKHGGDVTIINFSSMLNPDADSGYLNESMLFEDVHSKEPYLPYCKGERAIEDAVESNELVKEVCRILSYEFSPEDREIFIRNVLLGEAQRSISQDMNVAQPYVSSTRRWIQTRIMISLFQQGLAQ